MSARKVLPTGVFVHPLQEKLVRLREKAIATVLPLNIGYRNPKAIDALQMAVALVLNGLESPQEALRQLDQRMKAQDRR